MANNLKPKLVAYYDPLLKNWDQAIEAELERRGLTIDDLSDYCVFAIPDGASGAYYDNL